VILISFIDNLDGCRKLPPNTHNYDEIAKYIGHPLCNIPDPYGEYKSFGDRNSESLKHLITSFGYKFVEYVPTIDNPYSVKNLLKVSEGGKKIVCIMSSDMYRTGAFDRAMLMILKKHKAVLNIILPTLGPERSATYSPFMPISPKTGKVLEKEVVGYNIENGTVDVEEDGEKYSVPVTKGHCKLQWKIDFGMRWFVLDVDYEIGGKDIEIGTVPIAKAVCKLLKGNPPINMMYEMFLGDDGTRISKTKGNGISAEELMKYVHMPAIKRFMYVNPMVAKKLDMDKVPSYTDEYIRDLKKFIEDESTENAVWYCDVKDLTLPNISASMALTLIENVQIKDEEKLIDFFSRKIQDFNWFDMDILLKMHAFWLADSYAESETMTPQEWMIPYLEELIERISDDADEMQAEVYELGNIAIRQQNVADLKEWFRLLYRCILGKDSGPRLGCFFAMYGEENTRNLLSNIISKAKSQQN
jgi:lysyl-tRNA synthetase class 1